VSSLLKDTSIYTIGRIIPQLTGFILLPLYTKYLSPEEYGIVQSMQVLTAILCIFFSLASERSIFRLFYDYKNETDQKIFIGNILIITTVFSILSFLLLFIFNNVTQKIFDKIDFYPYYAYAILNTLFVSFAFIPNNLLQVKGMALKFTLLSIISFFVGSAFIIYYVAFNNEGASGMLKGQMIGNGIMLVIYIPIILKNALFHFDQKIIKNIIIFSTPMIPALISAWILNMSNRIFIEKFYPEPSRALHEIGVFSLAFKIASISTILLGAIYTAYNPIFYKKANDNDQTSAKRELQKINYIFAQISLFICFGLSFFSRELIGMLLDEKYFNAIPIIPIIILSMFLSQLASFFNLMIYQNKKTSLIMLIILISSLISIFFNIMLIPIWGSIGAAWATVIGVSINLFLVIFYAKKNYYVPFNYLKIGILSIIAITLIVFESILDYNNILISLIIKFSIVSIVLFFIIIKNKKSILKYLVNNYTSNT